ncbi:MAG: 4Fe-4S binding protein [Acidimicrobiia bacterium]
MTTTIFVCGDQPQVVHDVPDAVVVDGLCQSPHQIGAVALDVDRVVLVLHEGSYDLPGVQKALRSIDVDPLGAQITDFKPGVDAVSLSAIIGGLRARASAFVESVPEHAKPVLPELVTRRGFLRPPTPTYIAAPLVDQQMCAAGDGCRACVDVCPQNAYLWQAGRIVYDKHACEPCGRCVTTCPIGAIENPAITTVMLEAQVRALVDRVDVPAGIRFVCSRGTIEPRLGWSDIDVPCTSMLPGSWLLACLLIGAGAATAVPCGESGCPLGLDAGAIQANDLAHAVLSESGLEPGMVTGAAIHDPILSDGLSDELEHPFGRDRAPDVMLAVAHVAQRDISIIHPASNLGVVVIDASTCTLCGQCAKTCPTDALVETYEGDTVSISFDARSCVNCTQCVSACPEVKRGAISVTGRIDVEMLVAARRNLNEGTVATCEVCGKAIAPATMMDRISDLLGEEFEATLAVLKNRCLDCRGRP